jgi:hypothetical protein
MQLQQPQEVPGRVQLQQQLLLLQQVLKTVS